MTLDRAQQFERIAPMIGNTPLLEIVYKYHGRARRLFAKAEYYNLTGSIKDRVALHILKSAYEQGTISPDAVILEATSGNTGISFSALGRYLGHKVIIYMPDWMSKERIHLMQAFGAEVRLVSKSEGGFQGSIQLTEEAAAHDPEHVFLPRQFSNEDNTSAHILFTGEEVVRQLDRLHLKATGVVAGVGTGGTIMGLMHRLKRENPRLKAYPLEPLNSPTLSTGYKVGAHRIQGISDEFIPDLLKLDELDEVVSVDDMDAIIMAKKLSQTFGIGVGISSGANFLGCVKAQEMAGEDGVFVTVFADDNKKYLSTDYAHQQEMQPSYLSKDVELLSVTAHR